MTPALTSSDDALRGRPAADVSPFPDSTPRTTSRLVGSVMGVGASSSRADPFEGAYVGPDARPFLAVDGDPATSWQANLLDVHPELTLVLAEPVSRVELALTGQTRGRAIRSVRVVGTSGESLAEVDPDGRATATLPGPSTQLRLVIDRKGTLPVGIAEVGGLPGPTREVLDVPAAPGTGVVLQRMATGRRPCLDLGPDWACSKQWAAGDEEAGVMERSLPGQVPEVAPTVAVSAVPGEVLATRLDDALGIRVESSSSAFEDPAARPGALFDHDPGTAWIPSAQDVHPQVDVTTSGRRTVRSFAVHAAARYEGLTASLVADGTLVAGPVPLGTEVRFAPVRARHWRVLFSRQAETPLPLRIREVDLGWPASAPVVVTCDDGLGIDVDGRHRAYQLRAGAEAVLSGSPLVAQPCEGGPASGAGESASRTTISSADLPWLRVDRISWLPSGRAATPVAVEAPEAGTRVVTLPASGQEMVVALTEGFNPGWRAQAGDIPVEAIRLEGWRQGWRVPAHAGVVRLVMDFAPTGSHRRGLLVGLVVALGLAGVAGLALLRREGAAAPYREADRPGARGLLGPAVGILPAAFLVAGPAGLAVAGLLLPVGRRVRRAPLLVGMSMLAAGWIALGDRAGSGSASGQLACVAALALVGGSLADPPQHGVLEYDEGHPRDSRGDERRGSQTEPELAAEQV